MQTGYGRDILLPFLGNQHVFFIVSQTTRHIEYGGGFGVDPGRLEARLGVSSQVALVCLDCPCHNYLHRCNADKPKSDAPWQTSHRRGQIDLSCFFGGAQGRLL